ncbi:putative knottin, scorpion toxin, defensin, plant, knottin, scorpion toxin-like superfamily [Helianthus annuus]|nr:putative knottin, scorpion toxin, defensin, plant, knottin, scorpion toxin-like superfamily [Helianthus annuus]
MNIYLCMAFTEMGGPVVVEGRTCESPSHKFKGICLSDTNCSSVCQSEGFPSGKCIGFRRRCFCIRKC